MRNARSFADLLTDGWTAHLACAFVEPAELAFEEGCPHERQLLGLQLINGLAIVPLYLIRRHHRPPRCSYFWA